MASSLLNPEPSQPDERAAQHLPPKTYVDAAAENPNSEAEKETDTPSQYIGQGEDEAPKSPVRKPYKRNGSMRVNGLQEKSSAQSLLIEKFQDKDGERLTSVKPLDFDESHEQNQKEMAAKHTVGAELVSGRRAGAGWERSGYVYPS